MERRRFDELVAYMGSLWGRELSDLQRAGGWSLLQGMPTAAVENAVVKIAESGREQLPPWPLVLKTAQSLADAMRDSAPALPQADSLSDQEHRAVMLRLRARQTPEQRRRADRMTSETRSLPMKRRLVMASELLTLNDRVDARGWDALFELRIREEQAKAGELAL